MKKWFEELLDSIVLLLNELLDFFIDGCCLSSRYTIDLDDNTEFNLIPFVLSDLTLDDLKDIVLDCNVFNYNDKYISIFNFRGEHICELDFYLDDINSLEGDDLDEFLAEKLENMITCCINDTMFSRLPYLIFYMHINDGNIYGD